ncbi:MAG TPA: cytochrome P460 family protein, partial [Gemmatimonadales bacterium]|nr:cytochrome P460 family protein [Gemmatimonadales bacterium]
AADQGHGAKELHFVYASPGTITAYRKTGHFPDGSILVKEVFRTVTGPMTTGTVSRADALKGWFIMVRDSRNRHAGDKLWGDGWGWGWFDAGNPSKTTSKDFTKDCKPCHVPAQSTEWVYVGGYPPLNR